MNTEPIFVLGAARSGTTLLRFALDSHPRIAVPPEWNFTLPIVRAYGHFVELAGFGRRGESGTPFRGVGIEHSLDDVRARFRSSFEIWYREFADRNGKARWGASTHILMDNAADVVDDLFDGEAAYVVLLRHPMDQLTSTIEKFHDGIFSAENIERRLGYWVKVVSHHLHVEERLGSRCTRIHYEELVRDAETTINKVFEFLGESRVPDIQKKMFSQSHDGHWGDHKILKTTRVQSSSVGRWKDKLDGALVDQALAAVPDAEELMRSTGYSLE